jgi:two-component system, NarL family, nitrate/nitrite response regulator NarL
MDCHRVFLVDPNQLFREGLKRLLDAEKYAVVGEARHLDGALPQILSRRDADLVVLDFDAPEAKDPAATVKAIRSALPGVRIVVLTNNATRPVLGRALGWGIDAYLLKDMSPEMLTRSLQLVMLGQQVFPRQAMTASLLATDAPTPAAEDAAPTVRSLSPRERQILRLLVDGASNKVIARELDISEATVKVHLKGLLQKVQVNNRTQAAVWALNNSFAEDGSEAGDAPPSR